MTHLYTTTNVIRTVGDATSTNKISPPSYSSDSSPRLAEDTGAESLNDDQVETVFDYSSKAESASGSIFSDLEEAVVPSTQIGVTVGAADSVISDATHSSDLPGSLVNVPSERDLFSLSSAPQNTLAMLTPEPDSLPPQEYLQQDEQDPMAPFSPVVAIQPSSSDVDDKCASESTELKEGAAKQATETKPSNETSPRPHRGIRFTYQIRRVPSVFQKKKV